MDERRLRRHFILRITGFSIFQNLDKRYESMQRSHVKITNIVELDLTRRLYTKIQHSHVVKAFFIIES